MINGFNTLWLLNSSQLLVWIKQTVSFSVFVLPDLCAIDHKIRALSFQVISFKSQANGCLWSLNQTKGPITSPSMMKWIHPTCTWTEIHSSTLGNQHLYLFKLPQRGFCLNSLHTSKRQLEPMDALLVPHISKFRRPDIWVQRGIADENQPGHSTLCCVKFVYQ